MGRQNEWVLIEVEKEVEENKNRFKWKLNKGHWRKAGKQTREWELV